jgi:hypothetical protein
MHHDRVMVTIVLRRAFAFLLPAAVLLTLACGVAYLLVQQDLRTGADEPQLQMAEDAAAALDGGAAPRSLVAGPVVDIAASLAPYIVVYDTSGAVLAAGGQLDGHDPVPPIGVLQGARADPPNRVTWQPRAGVRVATVSVPWSGGTVLAGRSLRDVERREDLLLLLAGAAWLAGLAAVTGASLLAGWAWPSAPPPPAGAPGARGGHHT